MLKRNTCNFSILFSRVVQTFQGEACNMPLCAITITVCEKQCAVISFIVAEMCLQFKFIQELKLHMIMIDAALLWGQISESSFHRLSQYS